MLLTGDARSDDLLAYVGATGLERNGVAHFDVLKMPHHGSVRNVTAEFFDRVKADHYVISADGKNGNPDVPTLEMLTAARGADEYTIHLTKREGRLETFFAQDKANGRRYDVDFRANGALSNVSSPTVDMFPPEHPGPGRDPGERQPWKELLEIVEQKLSSIHS